MTENTPNHDKTAPEPAPPLPELPPFSPDPELIGYIERGQQKPGVEEQPAPPAEVRQEQPPSQETGAIKRDA